MFTEKSPVKTRVGVLHSLAILAIVVLGSIIYSNTTRVPFVYDDLPNIKNNHFIQIQQPSFQRLGDAAFRGQTASRPVAYLSFALNYYLHRFDVYGYHLANILIHLINGILVYVLAFLTYQRWSIIRSPAYVSLSTSWHVIMALLAACIFVAHPLQTQAVTYIVQRMTCLAVMFYLTALVAYIVARQSPTPWRRRILWSVCILSGLLGLGTKQIVATLPIVILLYEWFFFQDVNPTWIKRSARYVAIVLAILCVVSLLYMGGRLSFTGYENRDFTMGERLMTQTRVVMFYISLVLFPHPGRLNLMHHFSISRSMLNPASTSLALLAIVMFMGFATVLGRSARVISFGILWFFVNLGVESTIVPLELVYEHRLYLPLVGVALIVPCVIPYIPAWQRAWAVAAAILVIVCLAAAAHARNKVWQHPITLWTDVIAKNPVSHRAYNDRGAYYAKVGQTDAALHDFAKAIELDANYAEAFNNQGNTYVQQRDYRSAIESYTQAIQKKPQYAQAYANRGMAYHYLGMRDSARRDLDRAIELRPKATPFYVLRGIARVHNGDYTSAVADFSRAIEAQPGNAAAYVHRANAYRQYAKYEQALNDFSVAASLDSQATDAVIGLAWLQATCPEASFRDGKQAVQMAQRACELTEWNDVDALCTLAAAYAERGDFPSAIAYQSQALELATVNQLPSMRARLALYLQQKPYRDPVVRE